MFVAKLSSDKTAGVTSRTFIVKNISNSLTYTVASSCGEVEDVVGALTPVGSGVAQVFHDLLVELRLLLVAEVEEGEEEEGQEESLEVE